MGKNASAGAVSAQIDVICETCYITGLVTAELIIDGDVDIEQIANNTAMELDNTIKTITDTVIGELKNATEADFVDMRRLDFDAMTLPTFHNVDLNTSFAPLPNTTFVFGFGGVELFLQLKTTVSALKYQIPLVNMVVPDLGLQLLDEQVGLFFSMDLIFTVDAEIDITSGVHIKIADGAELHAKLFGSDVSKVVL